MEHWYYIGHPISAQCCISYRNQSFDLFSKTNEWFPFEMQYYCLMLKTQNVFNHFFDIHRTMKNAISQDVTLMNPNLCSERLLLLKKTNASLQIRTDF